MIVLGTDFTEGKFKNPDTNEIVEYSNVFVYAFSGDNDRRKSAKRSTGKFTATYKLKKSDFDASFPDLKDPLEQVIGLDVLPYFNESGKLVGLFQRK